MIQFPSWYCIRERRQGSHEEWNGTGVREMELAFTGECAYLDIVLYVRYTLHGSIGRYLHCMLVSMHITSHKYT